MPSKQHGFTLIELVIVIVILGILAAIALPKYVDLAGDARTAVVDGTKGAIAAAAAIYIAQNKTAGNKTQILGLVSTANGVSVAVAASDCSWDITPPGGSAVTYTLGTAGGLCVAG